METNQHVFSIARNLSYLQFLSAMLKYASKVRDSKFGGVNVIMWFRCDLRIADNPALKAAIESGYNVIPLYIWAPDTEGPYGAAGTASEVWLADSLTDLSTTLRKVGSSLTIRKGTGHLAYFEEILLIAEAFQCRALYFNRRYEQNFKEADADLIDRLSSTGIDTYTYNGSLLYEPSTISLESEQWHGHWGTLMPFYKACLSHGLPPRPSAAPTRIKSPPKDVLSVFSLSVKDTGLAKMPTVKGKMTVDWAAPIRSAWLIGEEHAQIELKKYVREKLKFYEEKRSRADVLFVSRLSPYIRWGQLSPHALFWAVRDSGIPATEVKTFSRRLFWRDLAYYQLDTFPDMTHVSIRKHYDSFVWSKDMVAFEAWKTGNTGFPMVDAGMREMYATGWMHQSVRMVVATFLTEYLNLHWRKGHDWFLHTLVDADVAINAMMWQNGGRSGVDQWNFLSSPETGSQDPTGIYVRTWCPELTKLSGKLIHRPWEATSQELVAAGVILGDTYPHRIIEELKSARNVTKNAVLDMRKHHLQYNDIYGYDIITLPKGRRVRVFTKEEYRLDKDGDLAVLRKRAKTEEPRSSTGGRGDKGGRGERGGRGGRGGRGDRSDKGGGGGGERRVKLVAVSDLFN